MCDRSLFNIRVAIDWRYLIADHDFLIIVETLLCCFCFVFLYSLRANLLFLDNLLQKCQVLASFSENLVELWLVNSFIEDQTILQQ